MRAMPAMTTFCHLLRIVSAAAFSPLMTQDAALLIQRRLLTFREVASTMQAPASLSQSLCSGLRVGQAEAATNREARAPVITIMDHRGCPRENKEYMGGKTGGYDDEMCVRVHLKTIAASVTASLPLDMTLAKRALDGPRLVIVPTTEELDLSNDSWVFGFPP